jgi:hypothetical protein
VSSERPSPPRAGPGLPRPAAALLSLLAGLAVALVLHYLLYRIGLPSTPFIYVNF